MQKSQMLNKLYNYVNNSGMESLLLTVPLFLLIVIIIPLSLNIKLAINLKTYTGIISIHLFKIRLLLIIFRFKDNNIIIKKKNKEKELEFELSDKQKRFAEQFFTQIKDKINVRVLQSFTRIGTYDALETSLYNSTINAIFATAFGYIKNSKPYAKIDVLSFPAYNRKLFLITLYSNVSITIFDLLYSLVMSVTITKRSEKYENN